MSANLLAQETSPYLLQHKDNPVHWRPWGPEALMEARLSNKPILLSVGYAACHWCHVMAHESFEDPQTAQVMNELFVSIKVDREERPDIDTIYQSALALIGEQGGWPLTMFLTPNGDPFWGGTYFPPEPRYGRPAFRDILAKVAEVYRTQPDAIAQNVTNLREALGKLGQSQAGALIPASLVDRIADRILQEFDKVHGGLGTAPKFPHASHYELIWRAYLRSGNAQYRDPVILSLDKMSQGGIYDHLGGGFARYSTDQYWLVPHFEKMLYDNAQMVEILTLVWQETRSPLYAACIAETIGWVLREMIADGGGFAATLDADSEGVEGKFYVWSEAEIDSVLGADSSLFKSYYDVRPGGNWEGHTILNRTHRPQWPDDTTNAKLAESRQKLLAARDKRVRPGWDDKVLADWNGLMIAAMAQAGVVFEREDWVAAAIRAFDYVVMTMSVRGRLMHSIRRSTKRGAGMLDDYAQMARAALMLFEISGEQKYLEHAEAWVATLDAHFWDDANGGYFFTADDAEGLIVRTRAAHDNATPSGNGTMAGVLARLWFVTGKDAYRARAEALISAFAGEISRNFFPLPTLLNSNLLLQHGTQIAIIGEDSDPGLAALLEAVYGVSLPDRIVTVAAPGETLPETHPAFGKTAVGGKATAYVCVGTVCSLPITEPDPLIAALKASRVIASAEPMSEAVNGGAS
jgi:uncharacterized protein YyaL (SSP411 family)